MSYTMQYTAKASPSGLLRERTDTMVLDSSDDSTMLNHNPSVLLEEIDQAHRGILWHGGDNLLVKRHSEPPMAIRR